MATGSITCPICNQETSGRFCENCGFEIHVLPEGVSDEVKEYENERVEKYKEKWEKLQGSEKKLRESESKVKELEKQLTESQNAVNASQSEISKQKTEFEQELQTAQKTNSDLQTTNAKLESDLKESQAEVSSLSTQLGASQNENLQLRKDLDEAKRKAAENKGERPKAFILLRGSGDEAVGAVYSGLNTYGCVFGNINEPNHQELNITGLKLKHFGIETVGDRFRLVDYVGDITSASGTRAGAKGLTLSNCSRINIGNSIKGTFIITI